MENLIFCDDQGILWKINTTGYSIGVIFCGAINTDSSTNTNTVEKLCIETKSNSSSFGTMTIDKSYAGACGSLTKACYGGGIKNSTFYFTIDYILFSAGGTSSSFGSLTSGRQGISAAGNSIKLLFFGGTTNGAAGSTYIERLLYETGGSSTKIGDLTLGRWDGGQSCSSSKTRALYCGGLNNTGSVVVYNNIDYINFDTEGNSFDFGDLTISSGGVSSICNGLKSIITMGYDGTNILNQASYINISTLGNATNFGTLSAPVSYPAAITNPMKGVICGGATTGSIPQNTIDYFLFNNLTNSADFGDLVTARKVPSGASRAHGGL